MWFSIVLNHLNSASHSMSPSEALPTTAICRSLNAEALQATVREGLAQGPYVAPRVGSEPVTLRLKGINAPPRPTTYIRVSQSIAYKRTGRAWWHIG